ncbi:hypothetical protein FHS91_003801 [Sphingobium xanthum]
MSVHHPNLAIPVSCRTTTLRTLPPLVFRGGAYDRSPTLSCHPGDQPLAPSRTTEIVAGSLVGFRQAWRVPC